MNSAPDYRPWAIGELASVPRAVVELARARAMLGRIDPAAIARLNADARVVNGSPTGSAAIAQIARVLPSVAAVVPWRADCLVQALAARSWLWRKGVAGTIVLGVDRNSAGIEPHAWLRVGDTVVTGGPIDRYAVLLDSDVQGDR